MEFQQANIIQQMVLAAVKELASTGTMDTQQHPSVPPLPETEVQPVVDEPQAVNATVMATNQQLLQQMTEMMRLMQMQIQQNNPTV